MMWVGLTGGIGSGKTTVASIFKQLGVPVYPADERTKELYAESHALREGMMDLLGPECYQGNELQTALVAQKVFGRPELLAHLNALVHPVVGADFEAWANRQSGPYLLEEAAILFETGIYRRMDCNILVTAPEEVRMHRVMKRSGLSETEVKQRMERQWPDEKKAKLADYIIHNTGEISLIHQVLKIHEDLIRRANSGS